MSNVPAPSSMPDELTPDQIIAFLKSNPDFFCNHSDILSALSFPSAKEEQGVANFQSYRIEKLQSDKNQIEQATRALVANARSNMNNQARIHSAVLRLLEAHSFDDFIACITMDLANLMGVDISSFVVETDGGMIPHVHNSGLRIVPQGTINNWMGDKEAMLQDDMRGLDAIYGGAASLVRSQLLMRIDISLDTPPALIAFGSRDPNMFTADQGTDQIGFLARVIERALRTWLKLPHLPA